jgi:hypothetical protein
VQNDLGEQALARYLSYFFALIAVLVAFKPLSPYDVCYRIQGQ